jgi:hypothetical protein
VDKKIALDILLGICETLKQTQSGARPCHSGGSRAK